jgi:DNA-binding GntR family transcriptional regulator
MTDISPQLDPEATLYEAILGEISTGKLEGGQRLKVSDLAKRYGLSASPVREVLRRMQGEGFVDISPNRGATVRKATAHTMQNIFEVLQLLEPYFVTWFADYADPKTIAEMEQLQELIRQNADSDLPRFRKLDYEFHRCICKDHYNQVAIESWQNLRRALNVHGAKLRISAPRYHNIIEEHDELLAAFRAHDAARADAAIRKHVSGSFVQMSQQMRAMGY